MPWLITLECDYIVWPPLELIAIYVNLLFFRIRQYQYNRLQHFLVIFSITLRSERYSGYRHVCGIDMITSLFNSRSFTLSREDGYQSRYPVIERGRF